jgi:hypothetical protein
LSERYISTPFVRPGRARKSLPFAVPFLRLRRQAPSGDRHVPTVSFEERRVTGHCVALTAARVGAAPLRPQPARQHATTVETARAWSARVIAKSVIPTRGPLDYPFANRVLSKRAPFPWTSITD